ncbi:MAG TPA: PLP-dependent aminotransferase family protein [Ktedonobacteraceae bacterium]|nr:PLP-dependent aminotransferase family protein [Ktedonobacteraceae bacterium]
MISNDLAQGTSANTISLNFGHQDPKTLLTEELHSAMLQVVNSPDAYVALQYGKEQGTWSLIEYLVGKLQREQGLSLQPANLMMIAGSTGGVDMLARLYAEPGGVVLVEAPTYVDALHVFRDHHIELCSIPMDDDGLIPSELEKQVVQLQSRGIFPSLLYTIPNFHNPTGSTLPEARRIEIIRIAQRYGLLIVEDDVYRDLAFEGELPASFYALANGKQVFSIGSFSKTLAPGLRLGWLVGSEESIQYCVNCGVAQMGGGANPFVARMVAEYCQTGALEKHIHHLQSLYKMRCDVALEALSKYMPSDTKWTCPKGGFFIWLSLPENAFVQDVKRLAEHDGVLVSAGEGFFVNPGDGEHNLRIAFSCAKPEDIGAGIRILAQVIEKARVG